jgi:hypothetical protein
MTAGKRLALDILISALFAIVAAAAGLLVGTLLSCIALWVLPGSESPGTFAAVVYLTLFPWLCGIIGGFFAFPLCAIWLDQRRHASRSNSLTPQG